METNPTPTTGNVVQLRPRKVPKLAPAMPSHLNLVMAVIWSLPAKRRRAVLRAFVGRPWETVVRTADPVDQTAIMVILQEAW